MAKYRKKPVVIEAVQWWPPPQPNPHPAPPAPRRCHPEAGGSDAKMARANELRKWAFR
jgi:hypothetical protein